METIVLDSNVTGEEPRLYNYNGNTYQIKGSDVVFLDTIRKCPTGLKFLILAIQWREAEEYIKEQKKLWREEVATYFSKKWMWRETGERVNWNNTSLNKEFFGVSATKRKIAADILNGKLTDDQVSKIESFFEEEEDLREIY